MAKLSIVATPIGNLEDITFRAVRILQEADFILCEDTRLTKRLLDNYKIKTPTISYHQHSGRLKTDKLLELLRAGKNLALVTDAGTPGISDPGSQLVSAVRAEFNNEVRLESIPGPSALATALALAGNGFDRFLFLGFLPHKKGRQTKIKEIAASAYPIIAYESKHRILKLLAELGHQEVLLARELTKIHEQFYSGRADEVAAELEAGANNLKGEFVILIRPLISEK